MKMIRVTRKMYRQMLDRANLPFKVAKKFSQLLRKEMQADLDIAIKRNRAEKDHNICHTHDFCDANMVMDAAMRSCKVDTDDVDVWNEAWSFAKKAEFDPKRIK